MAKIKKAPAVMPKIKAAPTVTLVTSAVPTKPEIEAILENASDWVSGNLRGIADRLAMCRLRNEPPPEWACNAVRDLADLADVVTNKKILQIGRQLTRYVAVREAHDRDGLTWDEAPRRAAAMLRGTPAEGEPSTMLAAYKEVRKAMRDARVARKAMRDARAYRPALERALDDDNPAGYRWIDLTKTPG